MVKHGINTIRMFQESFTELGSKDVISPTDFNTLGKRLRVFNETLDMFREFFHNVCKLNKVSKLQHRCFF